MKLEDTPWQCIPNSIRSFQVQFMATPRMKTGLTKLYVLKKGKLLNRYWNFGAAQFPGFYERKQQILMSELCYVLFIYNQIGAHEAITLH